VSAVMNSEDVASYSSSASDTIEVREGDWKAYLQQCKKAYEDKAIIEQYGSITAYKRACAMAYLGRRAQCHGGVYSISHSHIMTPTFITNLEASNKIQRYSRYPWLEAMSNILNEIERLQDEIATNTNVLSLVPSAK
jgi:hypothetical protein